MKIRCRENDNYSLTIGKEYEVLETKIYGTTHWYKILNNINYKSWYKNEMFEIIEEQQKGSN